MNTLKCIIVDDEPLAVRLLQSFVEKTPNLELIAAHTDPIEALEAIKKGEANIVFLDIQMPDIDGMELARSVPPTTRIIFTTAFKEYAFESYEVAALDKYCKKYRVKNRTKLVREILFTKIFTDFNSNPPTLFGEDEMARLAQK